ncbi:Uncharacterised protein [Raoultella ornithinolytica]|nr:Uncharacterised protein [Raoultella ornithinolytica]
MAGDQAVQHVGEAVFILIGFAIKQHQRPARGLRQARTVDHHFPGIMQKIAAQLMAGQSAIAQRLRPTLRRAVARRIERQQRIAVPAIAGAVDAVRIQRIGLSADQNRPPLLVPDAVDLRDIRRQLILHQGICRYHVAAKPDIGMAKPKTADRDRPPGIPAGRRFFSPRATGR